MVSHQTDTLTLIRYAQSNRSSAQFYLRVAEECEGKGKTASMDTALASAAEREREAAFQEAELRRRNVKISWAYHKETTMPRNTSPKRSCLHCWRAIHGNARRPRLFCSHRCCDIFNGTLKP